MKEKSFKPLLAPNEQINLEELPYSLLASTKLDGIRVLFHKGQILTRSLKQLPNKQLREKFESIRKFSEDYNVTVDGEIYSHELTFQEIISFCMTENFEDPKSIKKFGKVMDIPDHLRFYCFDYVEGDNFDEPFSMRYANTTKIDGGFPRLATRVYHKLVKSAEEVEKYFEEVLEDGYEGLILRSLDGRYKWGRATLRENIVYKCKKFIDFDGQILDIIQATVVDETVEKSINELGYSKTSRKKNDRLLINKASAVLVKYNGEDLKVTLALTDDEKTEIWEHKEDYIGKWITYKGMLIGAKNVVRHPVFLRFRDAKE